MQTHASSEYFEKEECIQEENEKPRQRDKERDRVKHWYHITGQKKQPKKCKNKLINKSNKKTAIMQKHIQKPPNK